MLFSIIIPMYNAEKYLDRCIDSILKQSYTDYEVLLVDDGSTDGGCKKAQLLVEQDQRFTLLKTPHSGPGAARNKGLSCASGQYVLFVDADDYWIDFDLLKHLSELIQYQHTEVFMYQVVKVTEDGTVLTRYRKPPFCHENIPLELKDVYLDLVRDGQTLAAVWNKCVSKELLDKHAISFIEDLKGEDIDWVLQLFSYVQTICLLNIDAYAYTQHKSDSRSNSTDAPNNLVTIVEAWSKSLKQGKIPHAKAVAGLVAFEYAICMGHNHVLSDTNRKTMRSLEYLLNYGLDKKTRLIYHFYKVFGYRVTSFAIRMYLLLRKIW